jgi:hypothetical protein
MQEMIDSSDEEIKKRKIWEMKPAFLHFGNGKKEM